MSNAVIHVENLTKIYPNGVIANRDVSLKVCNGEIVCLVGPNGAGKTTLVRQVMGLLKPTRGRVRVLGVDPFKEQYVVRENIGYVPQMPLAFPAHKVIEVLKYVTDLVGERSIGIDELLKLLELESVKNILGYQLSLGQRKLLLMAMALAKNPKILVMDEPTSFVDIVKKQLVWRIILRAKNEGKTIFIVSHDVEEISRLCDRVYVMVSGRIIYHGSIKDIHKLNGVELKIYVDEPRKIIEKIKYGTLRVEGNALIVNYATFSDALKDLGNLASMSLDGFKFKLILEYPSITSSLLSILDRRSS